MNYRLFLLRSLLLLLLSWNAQAAWQSTNPGGGGAMNSPVMTDEGYWVVGSDLGGIYVSKNQGTSWTAIGAAQGLTSTHIASLATHPNKLLIGAEGGLYVGNTDGTAIKLKYPAGYVSAITVAADPNIIYAAVHPAWNKLSPVIIRSDDAGTTWRKVSTNLPANLFVLGMRAHPVDSQGIWVLTGSGRATTSPAQAWLSIDGGVTWTRRDTAQGNVVDITYAQDANNLNRMYMTTELNGVGRFYTSNDTGYSWKRLTPAVPTDGLSGVILADSAMPNHVRLLDTRGKATRFWESKNAGGTWTYKTNNVVGGWSKVDEDWGMGESYQGVPQTIGYRPDKPNSVLWVNNQFAYKSLNGGQTWSDAVSIAYTDGSWSSRRLDNVVPVTVASSQTNSNLVYAGYLDLGLWRSDNGGATWKSLNTLQYSAQWAGKGGNTLSIVTDPVREGVVWAQVAGDLNQDSTNTNQPIYLLKSTDKGATWTQRSNGLPAKPNRIEGLALAEDSATDNRWLYVVVDGDVYLSENDGTNWKKVLDCNTCFNVAYTQAGVFALSSAGVWRSWQGGVANTWAKMSLPNNMTSGWTTTQHWLYDAWTYTGAVDIATKGKEEIWLAVKGDGKGLYYSGNAGVTWTQVYNNPYIRSVAVDPTNSQVLLGSSSSGLQANVYNTTSKGVLSHLNGRTATGWTALNSGLAYPFATNIHVSATGKRWVNSPGQGILRWQ
ncbi:MAG: hypothetical protein RI964_2003 [Pseudomonadota bacterium]